MRTVISVVCMLLICLLLLGFLQGGDNGELSSNHPGLCEALQWLGPWLLLFPCLFLQENRHCKAWLIFIPLIGIHSLLFLLIPEPKYENGWRPDLYIEILSSLSVSMSLLLLLAYRVSVPRSSERGFTLFHRMVGILIVSGIVGHISHNPWIIPSNFEQMADHDEDEEDGEEQLPTQMPQPQDKGAFSIL